MFFQSDEDEFAKLNEANKAVMKSAVAQSNGTSAAEQQRSDSIGSDDFQEFESYQAQHDDVNNHDDVSGGSSTETRNNEGTLLFKYYTSGD